MAHLIDKDVLVAWAKETYLCENASMIRKVCYKQLLEHLNTIEVKEVNLEKECSKYFEDNDDLCVHDDYIKFAKHFFELGLKAQKDNIWHTVDETPNYPCDILFLTNVDNMFLYRYMENGRPVDRETPYFNTILNGKCWCYCNDIVNK